MVARFNYKCDACGHSAFSASGFANDMPIGLSEDEWKFQLVFVCKNCSQEVTNVISKANGKIALKMKLDT
ncbi:hypothetical protein [Thalassotalea crassostreae]|uniref:hypothetical protein n=1 Tax=Thalassotalea crassostreae TaxID=1763536 RepID=UPI000838339F|nr:hypothetical protein [Thalassotalea crassostreae]